MQISDILHDGRPWQYLDFTTERAAHAMIMELMTNGYADITIRLGYRSYSKQRLLYSDTVEDYMKTMTEEQAKVAASSIAQLPGANPQQAGYSLILNNQEDDYSTAFSRETAYAWLAENCWKFGFIIRFPEGKQDITGISFEPWHYRYVGRYHAKAIYDSGLCLEEYLASIQ